MRFIYMFTCFITLASGVFAQNLHEAKEAKKVCELPNGYVQANDPTYQALADQVNSQRRQEYAAIAQKNKTSPDATAKIAAETIAQQQPNHCC